MRIKRGSFISAVPQPEKRLSETVFEVDTVKQIKRGSIVSMPKPIHEAPTKKQDASSAVLLARISVVIALVAAIIACIFFKPNTVMKLVQIGRLLWTLLLYVLGTLLAVVALLFSVLLWSSLYTTKVGKPWIDAGDFLSNFSWDKQRPLKICFITWGSRGDHQPMVALGVELAKQGHEITVMGLDRYRALIEAHTELTYVEYNDNHIWEMANQLNQPGNENQFPFIAAKFVNDSFEELVSQYVKAARACQADVLVGQYVPLCALQQITAAQSLKKPFFMLLHDALGAPPNREYSYNPTTNRITNHGMISNILNARVMPILIGVLNTLNPSSKVRKYRGQLNLRTRWPFMEVLGPRDAASIPTFFTYDASLWPHSKDFSPHSYNTGYFLTDGGNRFHDQDGCLEWLEERQKQGREVIYAALGSFDHHDKDLFTDLLLEAAEEMDVDVITLKTSVSGNAPNNVFVANEVPQTQVFPKCLVIVHHGGAGTASQVIRSGRPGVCLPAMHFQETWGARLQDYAKAGVMLTQSEMEEAYLTSGENKLLKALQRALHSDIQAKAEALGKAARDAPGVKFAANKMIEYLKNVA